MPTPEPVLETERLVLRPPRREDFEAWAATLGDPAVARHLGGAMGRHAAWKNFLAAVGAWHVQGFYVFSVIDKASGQWVGRVGPLHPIDWPGTEVGWTLARAAWGRGYATEAAAAAIDWAFAMLGWTEVIHCIAPGNVESRAVATRLGSARLRRAGGVVRHVHGPVELWGQTRAAWFARRPAHGGAR